MMWDWERGSGWGGWRRDSCAQTRHVAIPLKNAFQRGYLKGTLKSHFWQSKDLPHSKGWAYKMSLQLGLPKSPPPKKKNGKKSWKQNLSVSLLRIVVYLNDCILLISATFYNLQRLQNKMACFQNVIVIIWGINSHHVLICSENFKDSIWLSEHIVGKFSMFHV